MSSINSEKRYKTLQVLDELFFEKYDASVKCRLIVAPQGSAKAKVDL